MIKKLANIKIYILIFKKYSIIRFDYYKILFIKFLKIF